MEPIPDLPDQVLDYAMSLCRFGNIYRSNWWDIEATRKRVLEKFSGYEEDDFWVWQGDMNDWKGQRFIIIVLPKMPTLSVIMFLINIRLYKRHPNPGNAMLYDRSFVVRVYSKINILEWCKQDNDLWRPFGRFLATAYARATEEDADKVKWN